MVDSFQFWNEGLKFIGVVFIVVSVPCVAVAILGTRLINHVGQYPSRSAKLQLAVCLQLLVIMIISFAMLAMFFRVFSD